MMSNMNSPMLGRCSPFRASSVELGDEYQIEKDLVIGELTSRMKKTPTNKAGFDKYSRAGGDFSDDEGDFVTAPATPSSEASRSPLVAPRRLQPIAVRSSLADERPPPASEAAKSVEEVTATAKINPQRVATAAIKLTPSPKVTRKSDPDAMSRMSSTSSSSSSSTYSQFSSFNGAGGQQQQTARTTLTPKRTTPGIGASSRPGPPSRSISMQATSTARTAAARTNGSVGPRKPVTPSPTGSARGSNTSLSTRGSNSSLNRSSLAPPSANQFNRSISADPNMNDPAILAKIGNRATKTVQKSIGKCGACNKGITEDGCTAFGKVYHKACFKCTVCKQKIQGKFFERDGKPYCAKDFQNVQESCSVCNQPIKGDSVVSNNKAFHPGCMKCYICGDSLKGTYFTFQDQPICEKDYKQYAEKCHGCGEGVTGKYYSNNNEVFCAPCHEDKSETCPKCSESVTISAVKIKGASFHPQCFTCIVCNKSMAHSSFVSDDKHQIYCNDDYNAKRAPRCAYCKKPIVPKEGQKTAARLRIMERDLHPQCFKCEDCGASLDSRVKGKECYPHKNHILCKKCNRKKLSSSESEDDEESGDEYDE